MINKKHITLFTLCAFTVASLFTNVQAAEKTELSEGMYNWFLVQAYNSACSLNGGKEGLWDNEIEGKGGGFEEFCTLASEVVQPVVKKVFPKNETLYKKAVKQILVRMYQKIEMADMNQIREWMERFALDVLEKNYPRETAAAKKRETRQEQEPVKNEESLQKSARTEEQEQDELIAAAMAAFAKLQDDQPEEQVELPEEVQSFFEPEQPKEQDLQDTQELQIEITQPAAQESDEPPVGQTAQESEELPMEDDEMEDIEGFSLESDGGEDDGDEFEEE